MNNLLVIEDNIIQSNQIVNYLRKHTSNLGGYIICDSGNDAIEMLKENKIDIIILDLGLPDLSGIEILKFLKKINSKNYKHSVIIASGNNKLISELMDFDFIYKIMPKPINLEELSKSIDYYFLEKTKEKNSAILYKKICFELETLNYNFSHNGTHYLIEAIVELYKVKDDFNSNMEDNFKKNVYPIIAKKHSKTVDTIYGNIKQATKQMINSCDKEILASYFNYRNKI